MVVELYRLKDLDLSGDERQVFKKLLDKTVFEFAEKHIVLDKNAIVLNSDYALKADITIGKYTSIINLQRENNLNDVNEYIRVIYLLLKKGGKYLCCFEIRNNKLADEPEGILDNILMKIKKRNGRYFSKEDICEFFKIFDMHLVAKKKINNLTYMVFERRESP